MTTRRLGTALLGFSLTVAVVYVPACEYDSTGNKPGQAAPPTYSRSVGTSQTPLAGDSAEPVASAPALSPSAV